MVELEPGGECAQVLGTLVVSTGGDAQVLGIWPAILLGRDCMKLRSYLNVCSYTCKLGRW